MSLEHSRMNMAGQIWNLGAMEAKHDGSSEFASSCATGFAKECCRV